MGCIRRSENGNIFLAIFGAVAMVGLLGASVMTFMKGPLSTSVKLTKINTAESQMTIGAQVAVMAAANQAGSGDCDSDGIVEPIEWRTPTGSEPFPTGGGLVPLSLGINKRDPWGTEYGYCVWNHGSATSGTGCGANLLAGGNSTAYSVVALISAGPDKTFTTTCRSFATSDANSNGMIDDSEDPLVSKNLETDDDIITTFTYQEATGVSGGLWSLKAGDPGTAVINKSIESTGVANLKGGVLLPDKSLIDCADPTNAGVMARSAVGIELCDGLGAWTSIGGGASEGFGTDADCIDSTDAGNVRYNSVTNQPEFCTGTAWLPFTINTPGVNLVITPNNTSSMNVDGASNQSTSICTAPSGMICGGEQTFTITNAGTLTSSVVSVRIVQVINGVTQTILPASMTSVANASNFVASTNTCTTTLAPNATCTVVLRPKANGNVTYSADLRVIANNNPIAIMQGTSTNFGCLPGRLGPGGKFAYCNLSDPISGTAYNLVVMPSGCNGLTTNPTCTGGTDTYKINSSPTGGISRAICANTNNLCGDSNFGARNTVNLKEYSNQTSSVFAAVNYCDAMIVNGYSDWFLPSTYEYTQQMFPNRVAIGGFSAEGYVSSTIPSNLDGYMLYGDMGNGNISEHYSNTNFPIRCARRDNLPLPAVSADTDPTNVSFTPAITTSASAMAQSNTITVTGIMQPISVSITGGTGMNIVKNGVPTGQTSISGVRGSDTLSFQMTGPATIGTKSNATINIGSDSYSWWAGYADMSRSVKGFVTSTVQSGNYGGLSGADNYCNAAAAKSSYGLSSSWKAFLSDSTTSAASRLPWNWGTLVAPNGQVIVDGGLSDLLDGTFDDFFNINESGVVTTASIWTGSNEYGGSYHPNGITSYNFNYDWTSGGCCGPVAAYGQSGSKSATALYYSFVNADNSTLALRCIEDVDSAIDTIPANINLSNILQAPLSSREFSVQTPIGAMSTGATTTLSVTAPAGNPRFTVNGGAQVASATVTNGDQIVFYMDAPATASQSNKMTITAGATTLGTWRVWSGWDGVGTGVKRVFVTSTDTYGNVGGVSGFDTHCQNRATAAGLGGTWKAIASGLAETDWAVNRVGYNWNELRMIDGTTVAYAGGLWNTTLLSPIVKTETGATRASYQVWSNTAANGSAYNATSNNTDNNTNWTNGICGNGWLSSSSSTRPISVQNFYGCSLSAASFCIEQ